MDIEGSEWDLMPALMEHPVLDRIDTIFVETHEWMDPARYMPIAHRLQAQAEGARPSLYQPFLALGAQY